MVSHTAFDRVALRQALGKYGLSAPQCRWLDSSLVARQTGAECACSGYGLESVCRLVGFDFVHHDAPEDAEAAGQVLLAASADSGIAVEEWLTRVRKPIRNGTSSRHTAPAGYEGKPEGPLFGEVIVFTGALSIPRRRAAELASDLGYEVADGVSRRTTILGVGDQDVRRLTGHKRSSKRRRAEELMAAGQELRIL